MNTLKSTSSSWRYSSNLIAAFRTFSLSTLSFFSFSSCGSIDYVAANRAAVARRIRSSDGYGIQLGGSKIHLLPEHVVFNHRGIGLAVHSDLDGYLLRGISDGAHNG